MKVAVLALQGAFLEHEKMVSECGCAAFELRQRADLRRSFDGLILPGGESTVQGKLLRELGMEEELREMIAGGMPVLGTCAGLILLAQSVEGEGSGRLGTLPAEVRRNAYGRQLASFRTMGEMAHVGQVPMTFIRAPYITSLTDSDVEILSQTDGKITGVRYRHQMGISFHPELDGDHAVHRYFLEQVAGRGRRTRAAEPSCCCLKTAAFGETEI